MTIPGEASWSVHTNTQITKASHRLFRSTRGRSERVKLVGQRSVAAGAELKLFVFRQRCIGLHKE